MFAIVDIETTGMYAGANGITEIAIVLHNGYEIEGKFSTLVNPQMPIQRYVQSLTGITDAMVSKAPLFSQVAENIFNLLKDRVFVAHNVNFDYSFVKNQLNDVGFLLDVPKLCTIRLAKKIFPQLPKYGLATLSRELNISIQGHHRAMGDAFATAEIFSLLVKNDTDGELAKMIKKKAEQYLPPNVNTNVIEAIPANPGVYYFTNKHKKVVYVGKAKDLKKRIRSHFANNKPTKQKQEFLRNIYDISFKECANEFAAAVLESIEIKRLWPAFNKSQKKYEHQFGIFMFEDARGYLRLGIDKKRKLLQPLLSFGLMADAHNTLWNLSKTYNLHPALCFLDQSQKSVANLPDVELHNTAIQLAVAATQASKKTCVIHSGKNHYLLIEAGKFYGMGEVDDLQALNNVVTIKPFLTQYPENEVLKSIVFKYAERYPKRVVELV